MVSCANFIYMAHDRDQWWFFCKHFNAFWSPTKDKIYLEQRSIH